VPTPAEEAVRDLARVRAAVLADRKRAQQRLTALTLAAEVVDWRRFPCARTFMSYTGLVPCEYSSGQRTWRGHITNPNRQ
jgi:transposase